MKDKFEQFEFDGELQIVDNDENTDSEKSFADILKEADDNQPYTGPERRVENRRNSSDRRSEVRFEPGKDDRRSGNDRRKGGWNGKYTV